jgi:hypothetical protein
MAYIAGRSVNAQTGTTYTFSNGDHDRLVTFNNASAVAANLPQAGAAGLFVAGWTSHVQNIGTGTVTITPTTSTINGLTLITLFQWQTATITSDGTNYVVFINPLSSNDQASNLSSYLANDAGTGAARNQIITRNINTGVNANRKGFNIYLEHDGAAGSANYDGLQVNVGFTADAHTPLTQGQTDGLEVIAYASTTSTPTNFALTSVAAGTGVYTGTITNGGSNFYAGWYFQILGFTNAANNGLFVCTASSTTTLTLTNPASIAESHAATAYWIQIGQVNVTKFRWGAFNGANVENCVGILQYLPEINTPSLIANFSGFSIDAPSGGGSIVNFTGVEAGSSLNGLSYVGTEIGLAAGAASSPSQYAYGITSFGKTASIVAYDNGGVSSFIGHGSNATTPITLHDGWYNGNGSPEATVTAAVGSFYSRLDSTIGDPWYVKVSGSSNTEWAPIGTVSPIKTVTTTYSATNSDGTINCTGTFTLTLPSTGVPTGKKYLIKNISTGTITVSSAVNIDFATSTLLNSVGQSIIVQWDGTQWWIY